MSDSSAQVPEDEFELPPAFQKLIGQLRADRKTLMREKGYASSDQLRAFVGQYLFARLTEMVEVLGAALYDTYSLAVSNANQIHRMRSVYSRALHKLGADVDEEGGLPGVSTELLDELQQAFYALGSVLQKKLPDDAEAQEAYNACAMLLGKLTAALMGVGDDEGDDEDEDSDEGADEGDDEDGEGEGASSEDSSGGEGGSDGE